MLMGIYSYVLEVHCDILIVKIFFQVRKENQWCEEK